MFSCVCVDDAKEHPHKLASIVFNNWISASADARGNFLTNIHAICVLPQNCFQGPNLNGRSNDIFKAIKLFYRTAEEGECFIFRLIKSILLIKFHCTFFISYKILNILFIIIVF